MTVRGRPGLFSSYEADESPLRTRTQRVWFGLMIAFLLVLPLQLDAELNALMATAFLAAIGAIGLNLVTGWAGQVSLGHAFFLGVGAYTGAVIAGDPEARTTGFGLDLVIWLPAAGLVAAAVGLAVAPVATRLRGQYLAIVTLGLVFLGEHIFRELKSVTGGLGTGREAPDLVAAGIDLESTTSLFGLVALDREMKLYLFSLALLAIMAVLAKNLTRSAVGRAFAAVRDRDIAAEVIGVDLRKAKRLAFTISSFYAGCAGALLYTVSGFFEPTSFNLLLSVQYIAMVLIGGVATISGSIAGALFITLLPRLTRELPDIVPVISSRPTDVPNVFQVETILYGLLIVAFLIFEPRGLYGFWVRIRNYWKAYPFSY